LVNTKYILKNAQKLKANSELKSVYLSPDRTKEQRSAHGKLVNQMKEIIARDSSKQRRRRDPRRGGVAEWKHDKEPSCLRHGDPSPAQVYIKLRPKKIRRKLFFRIAGVAGIPSNYYFFLETLNETQGQGQTQPRGQTLNLFSLM
jgi:predicted transglutaminase-like protease